MKAIADLLFEARMLKEIPRSGYPFLGSGHESVAEHSFCVGIIAYVMSRMVPEADAFKLLSMCLFHDLPEARTGDMNYVHRKYVRVDEAKAVEDALIDVPFGNQIKLLMDDFNAGDSLEARLSHDADQLAFILELKSQSDVGYTNPETWLPTVLRRLQTDTGKNIAEAILSTAWDHWWRKSGLNNALGAAPHT